MDHDTRRKDSYERKREDDSSHKPSESRRRETSPRSQSSGDGYGNVRRGGLIKRSQWSSMTPRDRATPYTPRFSSRRTPRHDSGIGRSTGSKTDWDYPTPSVHSTAYDEAALAYPEEYFGDEEDRRRWEEEQAQLDREWYSMEENGVWVLYHRCSSQVGFVLT